MLTTGNEADDQLPVMKGTEDLYARITGLEIELKEIQWRQKEATALGFLLHGFPRDIYLPHTVMSMSPVTIAHILNEIALNNRTTIIEFGCGNSTIFIADLIRKSGNPIDFVSIDDNNEWLEYVNGFLRLCKTDHLVKLCHAPVVINRMEGMPEGWARNWYDPSVIKRVSAQHKFDLIIVDGPQGRVCPFSRFPAFPFLAPGNLADSYSVILDDFDRDDEQEIILNWHGLINNGKIYVDHKYAAISRNSRYFAFPK